MDIIKAIYRGPLKDLEKAHKIRPYTEEDVRIATFAKMYGVEAVPNAKESTLYNDIVKIEKGAFQGHFAGHELSADQILLTAITYQTIKNYMKAKQVFCFDKDMISELSNTEDNITFPKNVLSYLPCDTFYLDFSSNKEICKQIGGCGFIVNIDRISIGQEKEYLLSHFKISEQSVKNGSIHPNIIRLSNNGNEIDLKKLLSNEENEIEENVFINNLVIQSLIYLSSIEPDIRETESSKASQASYRNQKQKTHKKIEKPTQVFTVGERFGEAFRTWIKGQLNTKKSESTGRHNKPHFRRAHWHRYWVGKRDSEDRQLIVKWVHQCLCGDKDKEVDTVKHKVHNNTDKER